MGVFDHLTRTRLYLIGYVFLGLLSLSLLIAVIVQGHKSKSQPNDSTIPSTDACLTDGCISAATYQLRSMDTSLASNLCSDFYKYACGGWERTHPIQSYEVERLLNSPIVQVGDHSWEYKVKVCRRYFHFRF